MATKKDLVEAYSFSRRRLVTAFLSGAPGGREVEPSRPGRTVVGGVALSVLLVAGAAIASVLASRTEEDWNKVGLVVNRDDGAPYVILSDSDPTLIPVENITSAKLILGASTSVTFVDQDVIENQTPGQLIGILGAPQTPPEPKQFVSTGWTACTDAGIGITTDVSEDDLVTTGTDLGVVVHSGDSFWLLATSGADDESRRTYRYALPQFKNPNKDPVDELLLGVGMQSVRSEAAEVPLEWLDLFPEGGVLGAESFDFADGGKPLDDPDYPSTARVGDYIDDGNGPPLVLTEDGPSALSPFALEVLEHTVFKGSDRLPQKVTSARPTVVATGRTYTDARWPDDLLTQTTGALCARLDTRPGDVPRPLLAENPSGDAVPDPDVPTDGKKVVLDPGRAAFVRVGEWDDETGGQPYVIDPRGTAFQLEGPGTAAMLGYDLDEAPVVTDSWLKLFPGGVALSTSAALCPPVAPGQPGPGPGSCQVAPS